MEIPTEKVFLAQKYMIDLWNASGKPVIVATQMLESMINNPRPTRAEAGDVANAILDGADWVMLSGETANGAFPVGAVQTMAKIVTEAESLINYPKLQESIVKKSPTPVKTTEILAAACAQASLSLKIDLIIVMTITGEIPRLISKYRPQQLIFACCTSHTIVRQLNLSRGVIGYRIPSFKGKESLLKIIIKAAEGMGLWTKGHTVIILRASQDKNKDISTIMEIQEIE